MIHSYQKNTDSPRSFRNPENNVVFKSLYATKAIQLLIRDIYVLKVLDIAIFPLLLWTTYSEDSLRMLFEHKHTNKMKMIFGPNSILNCCRFSFAGIEILLCNPFSQYGAQVLTDGEGWQQH